MRNSVTCHVVADYFLLKVDPASGDSISNLKLQKVCFYAQAWWLAIKGVPLFGERIEAWAHGPVVRPLYDRFKKYGWQSIDPMDLKSDPLAQLGDEEHLFLDSIWAKYGKFSGRDLERLTHSEAPWKDAYGDTPPGGRCDREITPAAMTSFYSKQLRHGSNTGATTS
jgi:uncharacterized phage-associated protein